MEMGETGVEEELEVFKKRIAHCLSQFLDQPTCEAQEAWKEEISSEFGMLVEHFITEGNENGRVAVEAARCAVDLFLHLGKKNEGLDMLSRTVGLCIEYGDLGEASDLLSKTEALCTEDGDFDTRLACYWRKVLVKYHKVDYYTNSEAGEDLKVALQQCLEFADQNRLKFRNLILVDDIKKDVAYYLGKVFFSLREFYGAISNFMVVKDDERFPEAEVCYNLGLSYKQVARTNAEDARKAFEEAASYYRRSFNLCRAQGNHSLAFRAAKAAGEVLSHIGDHRQALESFTEAALLAKGVGDQSNESKVWWICGQTLFAEDRYKEALHYFAASLEAALQTTAADLIEQACSWTQRTSFIIEGRRGEFESAMKCQVPEETIASSIAERRAEAMLRLGVAKYHFGQYDQGIKLLLQAIAALDELGYCAASSLLRCNTTFLLAGMYLECGQYMESARLFEHCETMFEHPLGKIKCARFKAFALYCSNNPEGTLSAYFDAVTRYEGQRDSYPDDFAGLLGALGLALKLFGRIDKAILYLKEACKIWDKTGAFGRLEVPQVYMGMFEALVLKQEYWQAFQLVERFEPILQQYHREDEILLKWKALQGTGYMLVADYSLSFTKYLETSFREAKGNGFLDLQIRILGNMTRTYRGQTNFDSALQKYEEVEELLKIFEGHDYVLLKGETIVNQAEVYMQKGITAKFEDKKGWYEKALERYKIAVEYLSGYPFGTDDLRAKAYAGQAVVLHNLGNVVEAGEMAEKALNLVHEDQIFIAKLNYYQAHKLEKEGVIDKAIDTARSAAICFANVQMKLQGLESAWVTFFGNEMKYMFILLQRLYLKKNDHTKALLWAERGRMRLFEFKAGDYENNKHLQVSEESPDSSSSLSNISPVTLETQPAEPHAEMVIIDASHHSANVLKQGTKDSESHAAESCLIKKDGTSVSKLDDITSTSDYEPSCDLKGEVSARVGDKTLADQCGKKEEAEEGDSRELREAMLPRDNVDLIDDPLWFDKDDKRAQNLIFETLDKCGKGAVIIEYMYSEAHQLLITYILKGGLIHSHETKLQEFFQKKEVNKLRVRSLRMLVSSTLTAIRKKQDKCLSYLQVLYTLLLAPSSEHAVDCTRIVFVPHELLNRIPFAALHNGQTYLTEEKTVSSIPSIRSLHRCFVRQNIYENACKYGALKDALVAGNPKPMGHGMDQLPEAAKEAERVAKILDVKAITGENMTKETIIKGFGDARLLLISTHGKVEAAYPHGALVLRAASIESKSLMTTVSTPVAQTQDELSMVRSGVPNFLRGTELDRVVKQAAEVITAEEIASFSTKIPAGLVVLSACETGGGEVTSEGLLGLGRAVLQAGASAVLVSHWAVDDFGTNELMTGLFQVLVKEDKTVAESLQAIMVITILSLQQARNRSHCHFENHFLANLPSGYSRQNNVSRSHIRERSH